MKSLFNNKKKQIVLFVSVLISLEVLARVFFAFNINGFESTRKIMAGVWNANEQNIRPQPYLFYIPTPHFSNSYGKQHNGLGYRGPAVPFKKGPNVRRILCMGGSTTYGWGVSRAEETYPAFLSQILNSNQNDPWRYEVINAGLPSGTSAESLTHYIFKYSYLNPDLVLLNTGGNDGGALMVAHYHPDYSHARSAMSLPKPLSKIGQKIIRLRLAALFLVPLLHGTYPASQPFYNYDPIPPKAYWYRPDERQQMGRTLDRIPINENAFYNNISTLADLLEKNEVGLILIPFRHNPSISHWSNRGHDFAEKILKKLSIDKNLELAPFPDSIISKENWVDNCHLNTAGNLEKANYLARWVNQYFSKPSERTQ